MQQISIVGGGIAGLISAISLAEAGAQVRLHEAAGRLGGRARTDAGLHRVNLGPHALYRHGEFEAWLLERDLLPPVAFPSLTGLRIRLGGRLRRLPPVMFRVMRSFSEDAPVDESYRAWATRRLGSDAAEAAIGLASLPTFHADPGVLSAAFVQERLRRSGQWRPVYYILGGWGRLVERLAARAEELGVAIATGSKLSRLPEGPCVVATDLAGAARLLEEPALDGPGAHTALFDLALHARRRDPTAILDFDERIYASRYSAGDPSLAPAGESLIQAMAGIRSGESEAQAWRRIEAVLDGGFPGWRERTVWRRTGVVLAGAGAVDLPGCSWRDRPAIRRGARRWLVGDRVAAPGILSEVAFESAQIASRQIAEELLGAKAHRDEGRPRLHAA